MTHLFSYTFASIDSKWFIRHAVCVREPRLGRGTGFSPASER
jgi:hypothetical protein